MKIDDNHKICIFDNDDDFVTFAIDTTPRIHKEDKDGVYWFDFGHTNAYDKYLDDGYLFYIKDPNSKIKKRRMISYRTVSLDVQNLVTDNDLDIIQLKMKGIQL